MKSRWTNMDYSENVFPNYNFDRILCLGYCEAHLQGMGEILSYLTNIPKQPYEDMIKARRDYRIMTANKNEKLLIFSDLGVKLDGEDMFEIIRRYESLKKIKPSYLVACSIFGAHMERRDFKTDGYDEVFPMIDFMHLDYARALLLRASNHFKE
jgi:hypothetical protein